MSAIALCNNAIQIDCPLRLQCRRFTEMPEKKQRFLSGSVWNNECNSFLKVETTEDIEYQNAEMRAEYYRDNKN